MVEFPGREYVDSLVDKTRVAIVIEPSSSPATRRWLSVRAQRLGLVEDSRVPQALPPLREPHTQGKVRIDQKLVFHVDGEALAHDGTLTLTQSFELGDGASSSSKDPARLSPRPPLPPLAPLASQSERCIWLRGKDAQQTALELTAKLDPKLGRAVAVPVYRAPDQKGQWVCIDPWVVDFRLADGKLPRELLVDLDIDLERRHFGGKWVTGRFKKPLLDPYGFGVEFYRLMANTKSDLGLRSIPLVVPLAAAPFHPTDFYYSRGLAAADPGQDQTLQAIKAEGFWGAVVAAPVKPRHKVRVFLVDIGVTENSDLQVDHLLSGSVVSLASLVPPLPFDILPLGADHHGSQMGSIMGATWAGDGMAGIFGAWDEIQVVSVKANNLTDCATALDYAVWCLNSAPAASRPEKGVVVFGIDVLKLCAAATGLLAADRCRFQNSLDAAHTADLLTIIPVGNYNVPDPASIPNVITASPANLLVGACRAKPEEGLRWPGSRYDDSGAGVRPSLLAPGMDVIAFGAIVGGSSKYELVTGTSYSAAHVAGVAAMLRSVAPTRTAAQIAQIITSTAIPLAPPTECGVGRLNAEAAYNSV